MTATGARRWWALGGVMLAVLAVGMDLTVLAWLSPLLLWPSRPPSPTCSGSPLAYALVLAAAMLPAGLLGDRYGRKKVMLFALALFAAGSLACAYSRTPAEFIGCAGPPRMRGRGAGRHGRVGPHSAVHRGGTPKGTRHLGGGQHVRLPDRSDPRRLASLPLLVGLGVLDERAGRRGRVRGGGRPRAGVEVCAASGF